MTRTHVLAMVAAVLLVFAGIRAQQLDAIAAAPAADVLIAYQPVRGEGSARVRWDEALRQGNITHRWVALGDFGVLDGAALARRFAYIAVPRTLAPVLSDAARAQLLQFAAQGGTVLMPADAIALKHLLDNEAGAFHRPRLVTIRVSPNR